jgi:hypothetical protein
MSITYSYNHEANWATAFLTVLKSGATTVPTANIQVAQSMTISRSPRIEVEVEADERASEQMARVQNTGEWYYSHRAATITGRIVTNRTAEVAQDHGAIRARVRYLFSREAQTLVSPVVTIYQTLDVQDVSSNVYVRDLDGDREDVTEFRWRVEYGILPTTVPTI